MEEPKEDRQYQEFFCGFAGDLSAADGAEILRLASVRRDFYRKVAAAAYRWHDARPYYIDKYGREAAEKQDAIVSNWGKLKQGISLASGDRFDGRGYDTVMEEILDEFVKTADPVSSFEISDLVGLLDGAPEALANADETARKLARTGQTLFLPLAGKISKQIILESDANPVYGARLSEKLQSILDRRHAKSTAAEELSRELVALAEEIGRRDYTAGGDYPASVDNNLKVALYDNITGGDERRAVAIFNLLRDEFELDWEDPETPLTHPSFGPVSAKLEFRFNLDSKQISKVLRFAMANVAEISD